MYQEEAKILKAFCDENRLMILKHLQSGASCACNLLQKLDIAQSTLSHHMGILVDSGIVIAEKDGKWIYYKISVSGIKKAKEILNRFTALESDEHEPCCCE
ncbi:MAG: winged helix-turn-helix transcriptional regulator [Clostridia bacterium]|nr:winged helix-turn-helix transcriptional regulator [Clostridia bacterium]